MPTFENSVQIARPVDEVFAYLVDLEHVPEWNYAISETRKATPGPVAVGTTYRQVRSVPNPAVETLTVMRLDPGRRLDVEGQLGPFDARLSYELEADGDATRLVNSIQLQAHGPVRLTARLARGRVREAVASNLGVLKHILER
jgi:hypothetical protein